MSHELMCGDITYIAYKHTLISKPTYMGSVVHTHTLTHTHTHPHTLTHAHTPLAHTHTHSLSLLSLSQSLSLSHALSHTHTQELVGLVLQHCCHGHKTTKSHDSQPWGAVGGGARDEGDKKVRFLDVGCGSGAISLSLLQECPTVS